jgi:hypothetical protein
MRPAMRKQTLIGLMLIVAIAGLSYLGSALASGDDIFNGDPNPGTFRGIVPNDYFQSKRVRLLDWMLIEAMPRIIAVSDPYGVAYAGNTGSERHQRLIFQFVAADDTWNSAGLAAIMQATLLELFPDIPSEAWGYQVIVPSANEIHLCMDGEWSQVN